MQCQKGVTTLNSISTSWKHSTDHEPFADGEPIRGCNAVNCSFNTTCSVHSTLLLWRCPNQTEVQGADTLIGIFVQRLATENSSNANTKQNSCLQSMPPNCMQYSNLLPPAPAISFTSRFSFRTAIDKTYYQVSLTSCCFCVCGMKAQKHARAGDFSKF